MAVQGAMTLMQYFLPHYSTLRMCHFGYLQVHRISLPELFYPGDVVYMDPRVEHCVHEVTRTEDRHVLVFSF